MMMMMLSLSMLLHMFMYNSVHLNNQMTIWGELKLLMVNFNYHGKEQCDLKEN